MEQGDVPQGNEHQVHDEPDKGPVARGIVILGKEDPANGTYDDWQRRPRSDVQEDAALDTVRSKLKELANPKTKEAKSAQVEHFADVVVDEFSDDQRRILEYSTRLAQIEDLDKLPNDLPEEMVELIHKYKDKYIDFLRKTRASERKYREENVVTYEQKYKPAVTELKRRIDSSADPRRPSDLPEYLGAGSNAFALRIDIDGKAYAVKFGGTTQRNFELKPLLRAQGIPHAAQLAAYSFEDGVTITELLPGTAVDQFTVEDHPGFSDKDILQLVDTVIELNRVGITIDPKVSNFMYDPEEGFSVLDYHLGSDHYPLHAAIADMRGAICGRKWPIVEYGTPEFEAQEVERNKLYLPELVRYTRLLESHHPDLLEKWRILVEKEGWPSPVQREYIPQHPDLEESLKELEKLGF